MAFKNFRIVIVFRILMLTMTLFALVHFIYSASLTAIIVSSILVIYQIWTLFRYVDGTNLKLAAFLSAIQYSDFSQTFNLHDKGLSFRELSDALNNVQARFQKIRTEQEEQYRYLQTIIQHIGVGLLVIKNNGQIHLANNASKRLLGAFRLKMIDDLLKIDENLPKTLMEMDRGSRQIYKIIRDEEIQTLLFYATDFIVNDQPFRLVTVQNIQSELDEKEMEAWQNLIRILTHEIMNSITPIISLSATAKKILCSDALIQSVNTNEQELLQDAQDSLITIEKRGQGLLAFVENYRKLTRIPKPEIERIAVESLFSRLLALFEHDLKSHLKITVNIHPENFQIFADQTQIEQVLINLFKNACEAVTDIEHPEIILQAFLDPFGRPTIEVKNNGVPIPAETVEKIFIPFFTTKPKGSGIGLSLSRQIMRQHGGALLHRLDKQGFTVFISKF